MECVSRFVTRRHIGRHPPCGPWRLSPVGLVPSGTDLRTHYDIGTRARIGRVKISTILLATGSVKKAGIGAATWWAPGVVRYEKYDQSIHFFDEINTFESKIFRIVKFS